MSGHEQNTPAPKKVGSDYDELIVIAIFFLLGILTIKWMALPFTYFLGFFLTPLYAGGLIGALIFIGLLSWLSFWRFGKYQKKNKKATFSQFAYAKPKLLTFIASYVLVIIFQFGGLGGTEFMGAICPSDNRWTWFAHCRPMKDFMRLNVGQFSMLFGFSYIILLFPFLAKLFTLKDHNTTAIVDKFKRSMTAEKYIENQKTVYSHNLFYAKVNPLEFDLYKGEYRILDNTKRFVFSERLVSGFHGRAPAILSNDGVENEQETDSYSNELDQVPTLDLELLEQVMVRQLGRLYNGIDDLDDLEMIIMSVVLPRVTALDLKMNNKDADRLLDEMYADIDEIWQEVTSMVIKTKLPEKDDKGKPIYETSFNREFSPKFLESRKAKLRKHIDNHLFKQIVSKHAYARTVIIELFFQVYNLGVFQSSEFSWVKFFDRDLWAMLNNMGRPSFFSENIACNLLHKMEVLYDDKVYNLDVNIVAKNISVQLDSYHYSPELQQKWYYFLQTGDDSELLDLDIYKENDKTIQSIYENATNLFARHYDENYHLSKFDTDGNLVELHSSIDTSAMPNVLTDSKELNAIILAEQRDCGIWRTENKTPPETESL